MWGSHPRSHGCACLACVGWRRAEVVEHEVADVAAELLPGHEVDHGVLPGEKPAERCLVGGRLDLTCDTLGGLERARVADLGVCRFPVADLRTNTGSE
jgi:hypothetical protein